MQSDFERDLNEMDDDADGFSERLRLRLLQARMPHVKPGLAERVLDSIRLEESQDSVQPRSEARLSFSKFSAIAAAIALSGLLVFFGVNSQPRTFSEDEEWIIALSASNLSAADIPLIANLDELLEAEVDAQLNASWIETSNP